MTVNFVEHTFSPVRLLLVWQAPDGKPRDLLAVGELREQRGVVSFRYLADSDDFRRAVELGFESHPAFPDHDVEYTSVMDAFMRRLPPRSRGDYGKYLEQWRLRPEMGLSDFALMGYCGARLPSDGFSLVWPLEEITAPGEILLEVAGFRHQGVALEELSVGMPITFASEPENPKDSKALAIMAAGRRIGYVKRLQRDAVHRWLGDYDVEAWLERYNGTAERPLVYVFVRLAERLPETAPRLATG